MGINKMGINYFSLMKEALTDFYVPRQGMVTAALGVATGLVGILAREQDLIFCGAMLAQEGINVQKYGPITTQSKTL